MKAEDQLQVALALRSACAPPVARTLVTQV
jgi:hypothetical protein